MHRLTIDTERKFGKISRHIYGHFSEHLGRCIYGGLYVGEDSPIPNVRGMRTDVIEALKNIRVPNLRWPGGCFADEYHWKDGVGPKAQRKRMVNTHWGGVVEDNSFGTHEFMELCEQIGCEPYINGNVGSGTVQEMSEWVEYVTFGGESPMSKWREENGRKEPWKLRYFGVGNENWGCGGNMRPEFYADQYRRYQTYVRNYEGNKVYKIACGPNDGNYEWTEKLMQIASRYMDALTMHYYTITGPDWQHKGSATGFSMDEFYTTLKRAMHIETLISNHLQVMNRYDPEHRVGLIVDEWGTWYDVEPGTNPGFLYQQNTMRDALVAAGTFDIFNRHSDRISMANIAQMVNVLQSVILTDGADMVLTPTYHAFDLYKVHHDATRVDIHLRTQEVGTHEMRIPQLSASASIDARDMLHITLSNRSATESAEVAMRLAGMPIGEISARILVGEMGGYNDFDHPTTVGIQAFDGVKAVNDELIVTLPPCCVVGIEVGQKMDKA